MSIAPISLPNETPQHPYSEQEEVFQYAKLFNAKTSKEEASEILQTPPKNLRMRQWIVQHAPTLIVRFGLDGLPVWMPEPDEKEKILFLLHNPAALLRELKKHNENSELISVLISKHCRNDEGKTAFHIACKWEHQDKFELIRSLLELAPETCVPDQNGNYPLNCLKENEAFALIKTLFPNLQMISESQPEETINITFKHLLQAQSLRNGHTDESEPLHPLTLLLGVKLWNKAELVHTYFQKTDLIAATFNFFTENYNSNNQNEDCLSEHIISYFIAILRKIEMSPNEFYNTILPPLKTFIFSSKLHVVKRYYIEKIGAYFQNFPQTNDLDQIAKSYLLHSTHLNISELHDSVLDYVSQSPHFDSSTILIVSGHKTTLFEKILPFSYRHRRWDFIIEMTHLLAIRPKQLLKILMEANIPEIPFYLLVNHPNKFCLKTWSRLALYWAQNERKFAVPADRITKYPFKGDQVHSIKIVRTLSEKSDRFKKHFKKYYEINELLTKTCHRSEVLKLIIATDLPVSQSFYMRLIPKQKIELFKHIGYITDKYITKEMLNSRTYFVLETKKTYQNLAQNGLLECSKGNVSLRSILNDNGMLSTSFTYKENTFKLSGFFSYEGHQKLVEKILLALHENDPEIQKNDPLFSYMTYSFSEQKPGILSVSLLSDLPIVFFHDRQAGIFRIRYCNPQLSGITCIEEKTDEFEGQNFVLDLRDKIAFYTERLNKLYKKTKKYEVVKKNKKLHAEALKHASLFSLAKEFPTISVFSSSIINKTIDIVMGQKYHFSDQRLIACHVSLIAKICDPFPTDGLLDEFILKVCEGPILNAFSEVLNQIDVLKEETEELESKYKESEHKLTRNTLRRAKRSLREEETSYEAETAKRQRSAASSSTIESREELIRSLIEDAELDPQLIRRNDLKSQLKENKEKLHTLNEKYKILFRQITPFLLEKGLLQMNERRYSITVKGCFVWLQAESIIKR